MTFEIYSIGDAIFLQVILNAVAALMGTTDYAVLAKIGLVIGAITVLGRGILSAGRALPLPIMLVSMLIFSMSYGPRADVRIIDTYTDAVIPVDNVPLGVAFTGSLVSQMGHWTAKMFELAFSAPAMTQHGYGFSLDVIKKIRLNTMSPINYGPANSPVAGTDLWESWKNYMVECTIVAIQKGMKTVAEVYTSRETGSFIEAIRYQPPNDGTLIRIHDVALLQTCKDAYEILRDYTENRFLVDYKQNVLTRVLHVPTGDAAHDKVAAALGGVGVTTTVDDFIVTSLLIPIYHVAAAERMNRDFKGTYAQSIEDAQRARNAQWMAEQSMFDAYMRPILTFLEGFYFAAAPLVLVLMTTALLGFGILGRFIQGYFLIVLWQALLALVHLYMHMSLDGAFTQLAAAGESLATMNGMFVADEKVQYYLAAGGMAASLVPVLALALVVGGSVTANAMVSRIGGADTYTEQQAAPLSYGPVPTTMLEPPQQYSAAAQITTRGGVDKTLPVYAVGNDVVQAKEEAEARSEQATTTFRESFGRTVSDMAQTEQRALFNQLFSDRRALDSTRAYKTVAGEFGQLVDNIAASHGVSRDEAMRVAAGAALDASLKVAGGGTIGFASGRIGLGGTVKGGADYSEGTAERRAMHEEIRAAVGERFGTDKEFGTSFANALAHDVQHGLASGALTSATLREDEALQKDAAEVVSASKTVSDATRRAENLGQHWSLSEEKVVGRILQNGDALIQMGWGMEGRGLTRPAREYVRAHEAELAADYAGNQQAMMVASWLRTLTGNTPSSHTDPHLTQWDTKEDREAFLGRILRQVAGMDTGSGLSAGSEMTGPKFGAVRDRVEEGWQSHGSMIQGEAEAQIAAQGGALAQGHERVYGDEEQAQLQRQVAITGAANKELHNLRVEGREDEMEALRDQPNNADRFETTKAAARTLIKAGAWADELLQSDSDSEIPPPPVSEYGSDRGNALPRNFEPLPDSAAAGPSAGGNDEALADEPRKPSD